MRKESVFRGHSYMKSSLRGGGGISQNMTIDDKWGGGVHQKITDDGDGIENEIKDKSNQNPI